MNALPVDDRLHGSRLSRRGHGAHSEPRLSPACYLMAPQGVRGASPVSAPMAPSSYGINTGRALPGVEFGVFLYAGRTQDGDTTHFCKWPVMSPPSTSSVRVNLSGIQWEVPMIDCDKNWHQGWNGSVQRCAGREEVVFGWTRILLAAWDHLWTPEQAVFKTPCNLLHKRSTETRKRAEIRSQIIAT